MVDSVRFAIKLSKEDALTAQRHAAFVVGQAGFISRKITLSTESGLNKLSIDTRGRDTYLTVECSAPNLLFGNNVAELSDSDVGVFCDCIRDMINSRLELQLSSHDILTADIRWIHFGKNIIMPNQSSITEVLGYATRADISLNKSISSVKYQDGNSFHLRTSSYDITLYDKASENRTKKLVGQHSLSSTRSILRIEVRLNNKRAISRFCPMDAYTVETLFKNTVSRDVVLKGFGMIFDVNRYGNTNFSIASIEKLCAENPGDLLSGIGLNYLLKESGVAATKHLLKMNFGTHVWRRYRRLSVKSEPSDSVKYMRSKLEEWENIPP